MNNIKKIAKKLINAFYNISDISVKNYKSVIDRLQRQINDKIKSFNLPFNFKIEVIDLMLYQDENEYQMQLDGYGLHNDDFLAISLFSEMVDVNVLPIVINLPLIQEQHYIEGMSLNEVYNELEITLYHELAHGLIWRFNEEFQDIPFDYNDENICQQFGRAKGNLNNSKLGKFINEFKYE